MIAERKGSGRTIERPAGFPGPAKQVVSTLERTTTGLRAKALGHREPGRHDRRQPHCPYRHEGSEHGIGRRRPGICPKRQALEEKVSGLYSEVETELIVEDAKWDEVTMDKFVVDLQKPTDTIEAIDKVLAQGAQKR